MPGSVMQDTNAAAVPTVPFFFGEECNVGNETLVLNFCLCAGPEYTDGPYNNNYNNNNEKTRFC